MKTKLLTIFSGLIFLSFIVSCNKSDSAAVVVTASVEGKWTGNYNNGIGGPSYYYALNFKPNGVLVVETNNSLTPDIANGTWTQSGTTVNATYTYVGSSNVNSITGNFSNETKIMTGTIGVGSAVTGAGIFSVAKQ